MFVALRGRRWVLAADAATVDGDLALVNAFATTNVWIAPPTTTRNDHDGDGDGGGGGGVGGGGGGSASAPVFLASVSFAPNVGAVTLRLRGVEGVLRCISSPSSPTASSSGTLGVGSRFRHFLVDFP
jgi:hypothetical protein